MEKIIFYFIIHNLFRLILPTLNITRHFFLNKFFLCFMRFMVNSLKSFVSNCFFISGSCGLTPPPHFFIGASTKKTVAHVFPRDRHLIFDLMNDLDRKSVFDRHFKLTFLHTFLKVISNLSKERFFYGSPISSSVFPQRLPLVRTTLGCSPMPSALYGFSP